jgi:hypothetical protein
VLPAARRRYAPSGTGSQATEESDEADYVSVKCRDPNGYVIEFAWEAD